MIGLILVAAGLFFLVKGLDTRAEIREGLIAEQIITSRDASIPGVLVEDAATARAQSEAIKGHTYGRWGPYSKLDRDDPNRAVYLDGVTLRTALNLAIAGFGVADMAIGAGVLILMAGVATLLLAAPALYFLAGAVVRRP
ncbi:MAG: hypothetical protein HYY00_04580 [Chloroflexi bacterium]|nr:hypothetical protein [Chloroflexota bacterium]